MGGADGGRARVEGCGEDAVLVECAFGAIFKFCRSAGAESSEIPEVAARLFLQSLPVGDSAQDFAREQARMALDVLLSEMEGWLWGEDRYGRVGPKFRLKTNSAGLTTEDTESTEGHFKQKNSQKKSPRLSASFDKLQFLIFYSVLSVSSVVSSRPAAQHPLFAEMRLGRFVFGGTPWSVTRRF